MLKLLFQLQCVLAYYPLCMHAIGHKEKSNYFGWIICFSIFMGCTNSPSHSGKDHEQRSSPSQLELSRIKLPPGFTISIYAHVPGARSLSLSPNGTLFVGSMGNKVYAVRDEHGTGIGDKVYTLANGLNTPNGVAFKNGSLYIATISEILRLDSIESKLSFPPDPIIIYNKFPSDTHHGWKFIGFGPDGKLYVPVGAPCNVCEQENPVYASITRLNADGTGMEIFARGIRNTVGFDWSPNKKELWFTDNGRDNLGDDVPNDELNLAPKAGMHFGFPYCHQGNILDPEFGKGKACSDYIPPALNLGAHVASLGMRFYTGSMFPAEYRHAIFIAEHGSWNRSIPIGYRVSVVFLNGKDSVTDYKQFAEGWLDTDGSSHGRPVDVQPMQDGSLLVSDDYNGLIYRVVFQNPIS